MRGEVVGGLREVVGRLRSRARLPDESGLLAILLVLSGGAWIATAHLATADMRQGVLTSASVMAPSSPMNAMGSMPTAPDVFIGSWTVMMVAMMVPSVWPAVSTFNGCVRAADRAYGATVLYIAGYLVVWSAIGGGAYVVVRVVQAWFSPGGLTALRGGALLLIVAGLYQFTPFKHACLRQCRSPHTGPASQHITHTPSVLGSIRAGVIQGVCCLGSSWPSMLVLLLLGMMNLAWMGVVAGVIFIEKVVPKGDSLGKLLGLGLIGLGIVLVATPHPLPALMNLPAALFPG